MNGVALMHAGEEFLWVIIPLFVILLLRDIAQRRQERRAAQEDKESTDVNS